MNAKTGWIIGIAAVIGITCICLSVIGIFGGFMVLGLRQAPTIISQVTTMAVPMETFTIPSTRVPGQSLSTPQPFPTAHAVNSAAADTLAILEKSLVPINDPRDLAERLKGIENIPDTVPAPTKAYKVGNTRTFWATNTDTNKNFTVDAVLQYITPHAYIWVEKGVNYRASNLQKLANEFENKIYPTDRKFFGSEWTPGIDNDPHVYILFARDIGSSIAGYFSSVDELHPLANEFSNANEGFFLNADNQASMDESTYSTLAHEFQHMIHWYRDRNEETWMNEGFSVLAELLNQYNPGGFDYLFASEPDQQLNDWPNDQNATPSYYGSSFLFLTYFLDRFGDKATQALVADVDNGMDSVDGVLKELNITDPVTKKVITSDDVFADWVVTNYLRNPNAGDGRFDYKIYPGAPKMEDTETLSTSSGDWQTRTVHQYGADYIHITSQNKQTLSFQGVSEVNVLAETAHSGQRFFWSNKGDESDMTLSQEFDFRNVSGPLEMTYWTSYDLETDYDYLYLVVSEDGKKWDIIKTPSSTDSNPAGNSYGWGYTGKSNEWIQEKVDLSKYAGKKVQLRFEYVTDAAVNGEGLLLDDIQIPALNYQTDFEKDDGGWTAAGFVRIENILPQTYRVSLIRQGKTISVEPLLLDANQSVSVPLDFGPDLSDVTLVVSGTTRFTRQEANYRLSIQP